jgi:predicted amidophosphoribosyltransferase
MPICPSCGNKVADNAIFCDQCGTRLPAAVPEPVQETVVETSAGGVPEGVLICPDCGAENVPGEVFCDTCGSPLESPEPVGVAEAVPVGAMPAPQAVQPSALYCPTCGSPIQAGDTFCGNCGASLSSLAAEQVVEAVLPEEAIVEEVPIEETIVEAEPIEEVIVEEEPIEEAIVEEELIPEATVEELPAETLVQEAIIEEQPIAEIIEEAVVEEPIAEGELSCPVCGAHVVAGQAFCASCGAALEAAPETVAPMTVPDVVPAVASVGMMVGPYLGVVESGAQIPLVDQDELLVGREDDVSGVHPDVDLTPHRGEEGGVSRRHARLIRQGDAWFVIDLDSTNGTSLNGVDLQPKVRTALRDGDILSFGEVEVVFHSA